ncbi:MAG: glycosyltransferase family 4 protein [Azonexus sp.]
MISKDLRIGLVGPLPPPFGGMANQTRQLAELLSGQGITVSVAQVNAPYRPNWIGHVPYVRALFRLLPYISSLWRLAARSDLIHVMANSGWSWHLFAAPAIWIAHWRKVPVVVNYRGGEAGAFLEKAAPQIRWSLSRAALLAVPSGFLQDVFGRFGITAAIVPNIVNLERFHNPAPHRGTRRRLLVARNLEPIYDNETAIRAFSLVHARYPDSTLTIAGSGPEANKLKALAERLALSKAVTFTGRLEPQAMAMLYRETDIALNPSLVDNMPNSVLEALASGLPVVSTCVGGVPYIVKDGETALLVPPRSPESMASAIIRLIDEPDLCRRLIDNGLTEVRRYTWDSVWPIWKEIYRSALSQQNRLIHSQS